MHLEKATVERQTAGPPIALPTNHERGSWAPPPNPSSACASLLGGGEKQKVAWLHHCLHHRDNSHIYHLAIDSYSLSITSLSVFISHKRSGTAETCKNRSQKTQKRRREYSVRPQRVLGRCTQTPFDPRSSPAQTHACGPSSCIIIITLSFRATQSACCQTNKTPAAETHKNVNQLGQSTKNGF